MRLLLEFLQHWSPASYSTISLVPELLPYQPFLPFLCMPSLQCEAELLSLLCVTLGLTLTVSEDKNNAFIQDPVHGTWDRAWGTSGQV